MVSLLKDENKFKEFCEKGFTKISLNYDEVLNKLSEIYTENYTEIKQQMFVSHYNNNFNKNILINNKIYATILPWLENHFVNFKYILGHFIEKPANYNLPFNIHQDWSIVDEEKYAIFHIWIPFQDTDQKNGGMFFLPGSHNFFNNLRSGSLDIPRIPLSQELEKYIEIVNVNKGEALIFHPAVFHGSFGNNSSVSRENVLFVLTNEQATLKYYHIINHDILRVFNIDSSDLLYDLPKLAAGEITEKIANKKYIDLEFIVETKNSELNSNNLINKCKHG